MDSVQFVIGAAGCALMSLLGLVLFMGPPPESPPSPGIRGMITMVVLGSAVVAGISVIRALPPGVWWAWTHGVPY